MLQRAMPYQESEKRQPKQWEIILEKLCYVQTETTMRYYFTPIHYNKRQITTSVVHPACEKTGTLRHCYGIIKWCNYFGKCLAVPQNVQHRVTV